MQKKYVVRLTVEERGHLCDVIRTLSGTSLRVRRAQILLKADADGPGWTDVKIAEAYSCRTKTVENVRQRLVELLFQYRLVVEQIDLAGCAGHEQEDHALGPGGEMRRGALPRGLRPSQE